jgi:hypothetical protein
LGRKPFIAKKTKEEDISYYKPHFPTFCSWCGRSGLRQESMPSFESRYNVLFFRCFYCHALHTFFVRNIGETWRMRGLHSYGG